MNNFIKSHLEKIRKKNLLNPEIELRALLTNCKINQDYIFLNDFKIENININKFYSAFERRINYEPISKIFNNKEFWSLDFYVNQFVLDPRPESEFLIQTINLIFNDTKANLKICDLGTGSGCLAISLAKMYINSKIVATDICNKALKVAKFNANKHFVKNRIKFYKCNWFPAKSKFDIIVSNPPYLSNKDYYQSGECLKYFEPKIALKGGADGLEAYRQIAKNLSSVTHKNSLIFLEIGKSQVQGIRKIFAKNNFKLLKIVKDYQKIERVLVLKSCKKNKKKLA